MASKFKVGDKVMVEVEVVAIHHQGYPSGLVPEFRPNGDRNPNAGKPLDPNEDLLPDTVDCNCVIIGGGGIQQLFLSADQLVVNSDA